MMKLTKYIGIVLMSMPLQHSLHASEQPRVLYPQKSQLVIASFYGKGDGFAGRTTASGEVFNPNHFTAAHRTYPFGTKLEVINPKNGKSVTVRVTDRGPYITGRGLDLSHAAAEKIGMIDAGVQQLAVRVIPDSQSTRYAG